MRLRMENFAPSLDSRLPARVANYEGRAILECAAGMGIGRETFKAAAGPVARPPRLAYGKQGSLLWLPFIFADERAPG
jgi:hypothetical protein